MALSARNQIKGTVTGITRGEAIAKASDVILAT
jgi:molybdopterin-binding protein